jgi:hypothetical protein
MPKKKANHTIIPDHHVDLSDIKIDINTGDFVIEPISFIFESAADQAKEKQKQEEKRFKEFLAENQRRLKNSNPRD